MELLSVKDLRKVLGISRNKAYELLNDPDFPSFKLHGQWRVKPDHLSEWLDKQVYEGGKVS